MRRDDRDQPLRQQGYARHGIVAVLAIATSVLAICAGVTAQASDVTAPRTVASGSVLTATHTTVPDATAVDAAAHVGQVVTAHRASVAATALSLLLPLLLLAHRQPAIPVAVTASRFRHTTPWRRGPPTFLAP